MGNFSSTTEIKKQADTESDNDFQTLNTFQSSEIISAPIIENWGTFILGMYVLGFFLSIYIYLFGKNQAVANAGDGAKRSEAGKLVLQFDQMSEVNIALQDNLSNTQLYHENKRKSLLEARNEVMDEIQHGWNQLDLCG